MLPLGVAGARRSCCRTLSVRWHVEADGLELSLVVGVHVPTVWVWKRKVIASSGWTLTADPHADPHGDPAGPESRFR